MLQHLLLFQKWISKSSGKPVSPPAALVPCRAQNQGLCGLHTHKAWWGQRVRRWRAEAALGLHRCPRGSGGSESGTPGLFLAQLPSRAHGSRPQLSQHIRCWLRNLRSARFQSGGAWGEGMGPCPLLSVSPDVITHVTRVIKPQPWWLMRPVRTAWIPLTCFLEVAHSHCSR